MADMSGQAVGTPRWAQSASAAFLAKLLLAWVPLERRLRGSVLLSLLITESVSPFKCVCSGAERASSDRREWAVCLLQSGVPGCPHRASGAGGGADTRGQRSLLPRMVCSQAALTVVPLVSGLIHSFHQSFVHLGMCSRSWGYNSEQDRQGPCPHCGETRE